MEQSHALGAGWMRTNLAWGIVESKEGVFDWSVPDTMVQEAERYSVKLLITVVGSSGGHAQLPQPPFATPGEVKNRAYERFLRELVRRYKGKVQHWQIENEITASGQFFVGSIDDYVQVLRRAYRIVKEEDSSAQVVLAGFPTGPVEWFLSGLGPMNTTWTKEQVANYRAILSKARDAFDILDLHLYITPETMPQRIQFFRNEMRSLGYERPIWVTETGGPDTRYIDARGPDKSDLSFRNLPQDVQAAELIKRFTFALANGVEHIFWYPIAGTNPPTDVWHGMSLLRQQERTLAYTAYQTTAQRLRGFTSVAHVPMTTGVTAYRFTRPSGDVYVVWADQPRTISLPTATPAVKVVDIKGETKDGVATALAVGPQPVFVEAASSGSR